VLTEEVKKRKTPTWLNDGWKGFLEFLYNVRKRRRSSSGSSNK